MGKTKQEKKSITKEDLEKEVDNLYDKISEHTKNDEIVFHNGFSFVYAKLDEFIKQGDDGILYDLNRLEEVTVTLAKNDMSGDMLLRMPNDLAMATLVRYLLKKLKEKEYEG